MPQRWDGAISSATVDRAPVDDRIDGADGGQLDRYSADGTLPGLAALRARGTAHPLTAPPGAGDDAVWASFQYGVELGELGRYHYRIPLADGRLGDADAAAAPQSFWVALSEAGQRVAVLDIPKCGSPAPLNGLHIVDWSVHGRYFPEPRSQPRAGGGGAGAFRAVAAQPLQLPPAAARRRGGA